jgi:hypothetical protein
MIYYTHKEESVVTDDGLWIPLDPANTDYQQYLAWLEEGNVAEEWNPALEGN